MYSLGKEHHDTNDDLSEKVLIKQFLSSTIHEVG